MLAAVALVAAGCVNVPGADVDPATTLLPGVDAEGFAPVLFADMAFEELDLTTEDGLRLHADVYLPASPVEDGAPEAFPTILLLSPYWGAGTRGSPELGYMPYDFLVQRLLPRGYAVVYGDLAGNGGSSGCWDFMGPVERRASVAMVEAVAAQPWSDGKVGMMGLSYDGMTQIMAASDAPPSLVTVVPAAPLTSAYSGLRMNGVHYGGGWHQTIAGYESASVLGPADPFALAFGGGPNPSRLQGWGETVRDSPACLAENHAGDATGEYNAYYAERDYRELGANVAASVFYIQGFRDGAVKPDNYGAWFDGVPTLKKAWLGFWDHQYPDATGGGRDDLFLTLHRWFDHTLKGVENGIDAEPAVDVQDSLGRWRREAAWPPADAEPRVLQLGADGTLVEEGAAAGEVAIGGPLSAVQLAASDGAGIAAFAREGGGLHVAGQPRLTATLASDRPAGILVARLFDGDRMVTQGAFNLLFAGGLERAEPLTPGAPVTISFDLYPTDWVVEEGLRLELSTVDPTLWFDPEATGATLTLQAGEGATLALPLVARSEADAFLTSCGLALKDEVDGCWKELEDLGVEEP